MYTCEYVVHDHGDLVMDRPLSPGLEVDLETLCGP
jgi:hypothetical protein